MENQLKQQFAAIGECMIELAPQPGGTNLYKMDYAGDTYNTAVYIRRLTLTNAVNVNYFTAIGQDIYSGNLLARIQQEGIDTQHIEVNPNAPTGLYLIHNHSDGEREFSYYRSQSAASRMLEGEAGTRCLTSLSEMDLIYFTGISLAIWQNETAWAQFEACLQQAKRHGATIVFDSNIRPKLWVNSEQARAIISRFLPYCNLILSTWSDEQLLYPSESIEETLARLGNMGCGQVILKQGEAGCLLMEGTNITAYPCEAVDNVIDTTGAGDAFNAGVIASLLQQQSLAVACLQGHATAAQVIQHAGAIIPVPA